MYSSVLLLFPEDNSTDFLFPMYEKIASFEFVKAVRVPYSENVSNDVHKYIEELNEDCLCVFIGHGRGNCLYGGIGKNGDKQILITELEASDVFCHKNILLIACNSTEFIIGCCNEVSQAIGFGSIPTDWEEVLATRNVDVDAYPGISEKDIDIFKVIFIEIMMDSLMLSFDRRYNLSRLYSNISLFINKKISSLLIDKQVDNYRKIADLLYQLKSELTYHSNYDD